VTLYAAAAAAVRAHRGPTRRACAATPRSGLPAAEPLRAARGLLLTRLRAAACLSVISRTMGELNLSSPMAGQRT
jgi:hypothetical protein